MYAIRSYYGIIARLNIGSANARDMLALVNSIEIVPDLKYLLQNFDTPLLNNLTDSLNDLPELLAEIGNAISEDPPNILTDGGIIRKGYNEELDELREASTEGKNWLADIHRITSYNVCYTKLLR